jgi:two-component system KDP operon response regulator KdpE
MTRFTPHILVADDDPAILAAVSRILQLNGFFVVSCSDGETALQLFNELSPALLIADVRMPRLDGLELTQKVRAVSDTPVLILSALADEAIAATALEAGADDYIRKPFGATEFLARVRAAMRRGRPGGARGERLSVGPITLDESMHEVIVGRDTVDLSRTEFAILAFLMRGHGRVLTHDQILTVVWGPEFVGSHHLLRVSMSRLRRKLGPEGTAHIETLPGVGYRLRG